MIRSLLSTLLCALLALPAHALDEHHNDGPIDQDALQRAWQPLLTLAGDGDRETALERLDDYRTLRERMIENMEVHPDISEFVESFWASLERFDLQRLHDLLPQQESLETRSLTVSGRSIGDQYRIGPEAELRNRDQGGQLRLGDFDTEFRSLSLLDDETQRFLLGMEATLAIGPLTQPAIAAAAQNYISAQTQPDPAFAGDSQRYWAERVSDRFPALPDHDVEILAPWRMAYPGIWDMLSRLGRIDGLMVVPDNGTPDHYQQADAGFTLDTERLGEHYPGLARHLDRLGSLFRVEGELRTPEGRLIGFELDTDSLNGALQAVLDDGIPLAAEDGAFASADHTRQSLDELTAVMDVRINVLGVIAHLRDLEATLSMSARDSGGDIRAAITTMPEIEVEGRALGFMPTGMINFFIPGSLEEIIEEFLEVATTGNQNQGITAAIRLDHALNGESSLLGFEGNFEALDNFFVRLGMRMVNRRAVPDDQASEDIRRLIFDLNQSFGEDVERYETLSGP